MPERDNQGVDQLNLIMARIDRKPDWQRTVIIASFFLDKAVRDLESGDPESSDYEGLIWSAATRFKNLGKALMGSKKFDLTGLITSMLLIDPTNRTNYFLEAGIVHRHIPGDEIDKTKIEILNPEEWVTEPELRTQIHDALGVITPSYLKPKTYLKEEVLPTPNPSGIL
jgi:hypothetical protein